jgi:ribonuclease VapC
MFLDASAIIAVLAEEQKASEVVTALETHGGPFVLSPLTAFEATVGLARARLRRDRPVVGHEIETALTAVAKFLQTLSAEEMAVSPYLGRKAVDVAARFGRVVGHAADLNFGDCFAYACAQQRDAPLLFVGDDFIHTDIRSALADRRPGR